MTTESSQGKIPLDDMRDKVSYSQVVNGKEQSDRKKPTLPEDHPLPEQDTSEAENLGFTTVDRSDALPADLVPARKHTVQQPTKEQPSTIHEELVENDPRGRKRSKSKSQDDYDKNSLASRSDMLYPEVDPDEETEERMRRYIDNLHRKLSVLTTEKQIAEDRAERATERVAEMKSLMNSDMTEIERDTEAIAKEAEELKKEKGFLKEQLNDAQSHIFSLQPYRKDLTPEEVGRVRTTLIYHSHWPF